MNNQIQPLFTDEYLMKLLGVKCKKVIRLHIANGNLRCIKVGRQYRYTQEHINEFINNLQS